MNGGWTSVAALPDFSRNGRGFSATDCDLVCWLASFLEDQTIAIITRGLRSVSDFTAPFGPYSELDTAGSGPNRSYSPKFQRSNVAVVSAFAFRTQHNMNNLIDLSAWLLHEALVIAWADI